MFEPFPRILLGLITGFIFGFLLQKGRVSDRRTIIGQFLLRDFTVMKVMLTAIIVGGAGVYAMKATGLTTLFVKPAQLLSVALGGLIFGAGMVVLGYCPGTCVAAAGEGKRDARWGVVGMLAGAWVYAEMSGWATRNIQQAVDLGPITLPEVTAIPAWAWFVALIAGAVLLFGWLDRREGRSRTS